MLKETHEFRDQAIGDMRKSAIQDMPITDTNARGEASRRVRESAIHRTPTASDRIDCEANAHMRESANDAMPAIKQIDDEAGPFMRESTSPALPVIDPTTADLMDLARTRNVWQQARNRLYLHALSLCRSACAGDKAEGVKLYKATVSGADIRLYTLIGPFIEDIERWNDRIAPLEKRMTKLVADLPIGAHVKATHGLGALSIATMIGHTGPLSNYDRVSKVWRRLGLAVSDDGSERASLIVPGIADMRPRRAAAYVIGAGLIKAGNERFRAIYDREKAKALGKEWTKARAHNHAMRVGTKDAVKQLWRAWHAATPR